MATAELTPAQDEAQQLSQLQKRMSDQSQEHTRIQNKRNQAIAKLNGQRNEREHMEVVLAETGDESCVRDLEKIARAIAVQEATVRGLDQLLVASQRRMEEIRPDLERLSRRAARERLERDIRALKEDLDTRDAVIVKLDAHLNELRAERAKIFERRLELQHSLAPLTPTPGH